MESAVNNLVREESDALSTSGKPDIILRERCCINSMTPLSYLSGHSPDRWTKTAHKH